MKSPDLNKRWISDPSYIFKRLLPIFSDNTKLYLCITYSVKKLLISAAKGFLSHNREVQQWAKHSLKVVSLSLYSLFGSTLGVV